jgi:hypothetical protein
MKTIITLDRANQPYGYPQLDGSGNLNVTGSLNVSGTSTINGNLIVTGVIDGGTF